MKQRIFSAVIGLLLLTVLFWLHDTLLLAVALAFVCGLAVYEVLTPTRFFSSKLPGTFCAAFAAASFLVLYRFPARYPIVLALFWGGLVVCMLLTYPRFSFSQLSLCGWTSMAVPLAFSTILFMHERPGSLLYLLLTCIAAWGTDTGAFFLGRAFGKRKLAPVISPNKTVEGAVGGLAVTALLFPLVCYWYAASLGLPFAPGRAVTIGLLCAAASILGDLFASAMKRDAGLKDFGTIIPGHGGIMDRFDSVLFAAPTLFLLTQYFPIFTPYFTP